MIVENNIIGLKVVSIIISISLASITCYAITMPIYARQRDNLIHKKVLLAYITTLPLHIEALIPIYYIIT